MKSISTKDLMLGDYVILHRCSGWDITVRVHTINNDIVCGESLSGLHWSSFKDFDGIPLTFDILERNGFTKEGLYHVLRLGDEGAISFNENLMFMVHTDNIDLRLPPFSYVHEFQHALKLLGIDLTIELL